MLQCVAACCSVTLGSALGSGVEVWVSDLGFRVEGLGSARPHARVSTPEFVVECLGFLVSDSGNV